MKNKRAMPNNDAAMAFGDSHNSCLKIPVIVLGVPQELEAHVLEHVPVHAGKESIPVQVSRMIDHVLHAPCMRAAPPFLQLGLGVDLIENTLGVLKVEGWQVD